MLCEMVCEMCVKDDAQIAEMGEFHMVCYVKYSVKFHVKKRPCLT